VTEITDLLQGGSKNGGHAGVELFPILYKELRQIAAQKMANEAPGHTLQPTALVHEAWLRLAGSGKQGEFESRAHFFGAAAEAMRRILVDHARRKQSLKRGGDVEHEPYDESAFELAAPVTELLAVHEALDQLAREDPTVAELVKLRYFVGFTMEEAAAALEMAPRSAERLWTYARAWLRRALAAAE
jgi:RNA polymerase sigma factor (TIGR02999 family)